MWSVFGIFYLIALMQSQLNQNKALNTTEYSSIWTTNDVLTDNENKAVHRYISRLEWLAQPPTEPLKNLTLPIQRVIIAHTSTEPCSTQAQCKFLVRYIQTFHIESRGLDDIAYNFLIGGDGAIYEGRGWDKVGAHTTGYNWNSVCIAFMGTFNKVAPSEAQLTAAITLIEDGIKLGKLKTNYDLYGHNQLIPTMSPGQKLFDVISTWPNFSKKPESILLYQVISNLRVDNEIKDQKQLATTESPDSKKDNIDNNHILENKPVHRYITRSEWIPTEPSQNQTLPIQRVIIAHTATEPCSTQAQCTLQVRYIQTFHIESRGFNDIAYNFLIGGDGAIYEGRGWDKVGAHTIGYNSDSVCIAFIGTFNTVAPSESQLTAAITLIEDGVKLGKLKTNYDLYGHNQLIPTMSPGQKLFDVISTWPNFSKKPEIILLYQVISNLSVDNEIKDQKQLATTESPDSKKDNIENKPVHRYITRSEWIPKDGRWSKIRQTQFQL